MASRVPRAFNIEVQFDRRDDGGLRAICPKVPNFFLSHSDPELVRADIIPALTVILSEMFGMPMEVRELNDLGDDLDAVMPAHLCGRQSFVGLSSSH